MLKADPADLNTDLINKVIEGMKEDSGEAIIMNSFLDDEQKFEDTGCGTAGCIGGWIHMVAFAGATKVHRREIRKRNWEVVAAELIGIVDPDTYTRNSIANQLFYMQGHPYDTHDFDALPDPIRRQAAINVLERFRDTGEVAWEAAIDQAKADHNYVEGDDGHE